MPHEFVLRHRVEFADTDMAGIIHFSSYFRYMEVTEHAFFRSLGFSVASRDAGIGWPRVDVGCEFRAPLRFEDELDVRLVVVEKKSKSLRYEFHITKVGEEPLLEVATGRMTVVCVAMDVEMGTMKATRIPEALAVQIDVAPEEILEISETQ
ncbi:acyl-CoA thioesterase [Armatimonas sp.]|uniref:acyl-CoA thioesterase n=1 Tax=Armatimonas sp. TaxID=1872638 RepID=UPI003750414E